MVIQKNDSLKEQFYKLENQLLQPEIRKSKDYIDLILADDFIEFGSSGRIYNKRQELEDLPTSPVYKWIITDFEVKSLSENITLVTYRAATYSNQNERIKNSLRSSIWKLNNGKWQMVFHQGTPLTAP